VGGIIAAEQFRQIRVSGVVVTNRLKTSTVPEPFPKPNPCGILAGGKVFEHARSLSARTGLKQDKEENGWQ